MSEKSIIGYAAPIPGLGTIVRLYKAVQDLLSQIREDWITNNRDWTMPGFRAIAVHRFGTWVSNRRGGLLKSGLLRLYQGMFRYVRNHYGIEIPVTTIIGRRLWLTHQHGIVFHWKAEIGDDCLIRHNATIGAGHGGRKNLHNGPRLGHRVEVGPGAVIFAGIKIGDGAVIGPNVVIMSNVPADARVFAEAPRVIRLPNGEREGAKNRAEGRTTEQS